MTISRELTCKLTDEERQAKGKAIAANLERYDELEQQKKDQTRELSQTMKSLRTAAKKLARELRTGTELRQVDCTEELEHRTGTATLRRADTGEVVETRPLTIDERQGTLLEIVPKAGKGKAGKGAANTSTEEG